MAKVLQYWLIEFDRGIISKVQLGQCIRGQKNRCEMTEIVSRSSFCRLQDRFAVSGPSGVGRTDTSMTEIIEEAITKYLKIIQKRKKPKGVKKKKEILRDENRGKSGKAKITQAKEYR
jgi:hypothetical protein